MVFFLFSNVSKRFTKGSKRLITYSFANLLKTLQTQQKKNIARFAVNFFYPTVLVLITLLSRLEFGIFFIAPQVFVLIRIFQNWNFKISLKVLKTKNPNISIRVLTVVPPGIEPGTHGFSVHCSTI